MVINNIEITKYEVYDIRFPTSIDLCGSDAMNKDPDYSAAYIVFYTNTRLEGHGMTFTLGRGNEVCCHAIEALAPKFVGKTLDHLVQNMFETLRLCIGDSQLRWIGPEKGAIHLATAAVLNAIWDLWAKAENKPLWKLVVDLTPEELVRCIDFRYITDVITPEEAIQMLKEKVDTKAAREADMISHGYPAYTTSAGWLGYSDEKILHECEKARAEGFTHFKQKVGLDKEADIRRARLIRQAIGDDSILMMDANQIWDVNEAIAWMKDLLPFKPLFIEEPTSPDDVLGHATIRKALHPHTKVATGEHIQNRVIFKQLFQTGAIDVCQIDACRVASVNEVLAILLMAKKFNVPVCPHAGGVGLCEYVQHLALIDYICISGTTEHRVLEYVDSLHDHFVDPAVMKKGRYQVPTASGYSIQMKPQSIQDYTFPTGKIHREKNRG
ncbi:putative mandelate racemase/muconate lactonizing enzyme [Radiomyces spectabilis]|uniref:putative mandelate racemase/muconate lactonizing enzyme n=1 Tax=Radiomyces spectabilis TaxID=64574 RepID=UPI0022202B2E|nr:putative mandelate racemase/muconate lactonizing enzyme [Radiomyces spectabilis]KAI8388086.1 putative mandelate racemase/muconate lactonizing enzyme [Radiomyces spectabilis]